MSRDVIDWLESPKGESWSRFKHNTDGFRSFLVKIIPDDEIEDSEEIILWYA